MKNLVVQLRAGFVKKLRFFAEFILSQRKKFFTSFRMTHEGLRMT